MKNRVASLALLTLICLLLPASAMAGLYDNGQINGTVDAWNITSYVVSDSFSVVPGSSIEGALFGVWETPGDLMTSVSWSITTLENGGTVLGTGTAGPAFLTDKFISVNQYGYNIDLITIKFPNVSALANTTYWFNLTNAKVPTGDLVYWDENSGVGCGGDNGTGGECPSMASQTITGTIPSEAFTLVPEPNGLLDVFGGGFLFLAGVSIRKLLGRFLN